MNSNFGKRFLIILAFAGLMIGGGVWVSPTSWAQDNSPAEKQPAPAAAPADAADGASTSGQPDQASADQPEPEPVLDPAILQAPVDDTFLRQIWEARASAVQQMALDVSNSVESILNSSSVGSQLASANQELSRLMRLFQVSRAYPAHQEDILRQMKGLRDKITQELDVLEIQNSILRQRSEETASLQKDMAGLVFTESSDQLPKKNLEQSVNILEMTDQKLGSILEPGHILLKNLNAAITQIEKDIPQTWRSYYLTSLSSSGQGYGISANLELVFKWAESMASMSLFIFPQSGSGWLDSLIRFLVTMLIAAVLGLGIQRAIANSRLANKDDLIKVILGPWRWLIFGLSLLIGSQNTLGGNYLALKLPGLLALLWGLAALSWRLRLVANQVLARASSPLACFFPLAAVGVIFLFLDCPSGPMTVSWSLILVLFLIWQHGSKKTRRGLALPFIERLSFGSSAYFALASLLTTIFGYPRLAILIFMLLFTVVNILILASALISLGSTISDSQFFEQANPIKRAIAKSLVIPVSFILSLVCALPWLWAVPGLEHLLKNILTSGYTVGDASFDLTKILFIVFLFFLFRFIRAFSLTSLEQVVKSFAGIEAGVIPSLKALLSYLIWTVYAIIALALLGVNFTSLAVVAGGLSVGVGLGLQSIFGNLVSGIILMLGQTIRVGDLVEVGGVTGTVKSVHIRSTELETAEKSVVYVPNSSIMSSQFVNWTRNHRLARRKITVQTVYGVDIALAIQTMKEAALAHEKVVASETPLALFSEFGDNSLIFSLFITIAIDSGLATLSAIRMDIEQRFNAKGITLYNPCLEVTMANPKSANQAGPQLEKSEPEPIQV
ncbi:MAG: mechanosensitive ion channel [Deltaproteobacteria bacterium]|jgi:small-conductance mechanosensitive channel|nr:mechanosensitive ion channel [Deltaproteobacteria bacterium]